MITAKITKDGVTMEVEASNAKEISEVLSSYLGGNKEPVVPTKRAYNNVTRQAIQYSDKELEQIVKIALTKNTKDITITGEINKTSLVNPRRKIGDLRCLVSRIRSYHTLGRVNEFNPNMKQRIDMAIIRVTGQSANVPMKPTSRHIWDEKIGLLDA